MIIVSLQNTIFFETVIAEYLSTYTGPCACFKTISSLVSLVSLVSLANSVALRARACKSLEQALYVRRVRGSESRTDFV